MKLFFKCTFLVLFFWHSPVYAGFSEDGIAALQQGDFQQAELSLKQALTQGEQHPDLHYALAVSLFQQQKYAEAKQHFKQNTSDERHYPSQYFLGKIAEYQYDFDQAQRLYEVVANQFEDLEAQERAEDALLALSVKQTLGQSEMQSPWIGFGLFSVERNTNDGILDPTDTSVENASDSSYSLMAAGSLFYVPERSQLKIGVGGSFYEERYQTFAEYDVRALTLSTSLSSGARDPWAVKLLTNRFWLNQNPYLSQNGVQLSQLWQGAVNHKIQFNWFDVTGADTYDYLSGDSKELAYQVFGGQDLKWKWTLSYKNEDKAGKQSSASNDQSTSFNTFTSYGKNALKLKGQLSWKWSEKWQQTASAYVQRSKYDEADVFLEYADDTALTAVSKSGQRVGFSTELTYHLTKAWQFSGRYQWIKEDLNRDSYDFSTSAASLGASYNW